MESLIERPLLISPSLAATIGLEQALLYQQLAEWQQLQGQEGEWQLLDRSQLAQWLPFWTPQKINEVLGSLQELGMIIIGSALGPNAQNLRYSLAVQQQQKSSTAANTPAHISSPTSAAQLSADHSTTQSNSLNMGAAHGRVQQGGPLHSGPMTANWQPDQGTVDYLTGQLGISAAFIGDILPEFVAYWRDSGKRQSSWNSTFIKHANRQWQQQRYRQHSDAQKHSMHGDWQPDADALLILERAGISRSFIEDAVPEFILYWREKGVADNSWNSKFVQHVRKQWAYYCNELDDAEPHRLAANWQPDPSVYEILHMANIDQQFAQQLLPEFVLYWRDSKQLQRSWNSKFLQHVKYRWAQAHQLGNTHEGNRAAGGSGLATTGSFVEKHTDRGWREGL